MRKVSFLFAAFAFAACSQLPTGDKHLSFNASYESLSAEDALVEEPETRSNISDKGVFVWNDWDQIGVLAGGNFVPFSLTSGGGTASASFSGSIPEGTSSEGLAIYPVGSHKVVSGALTVNYPSEYTYQTDTTDTYPLMLAVSSGNALSFKHVGGVMRIRYKNVPTKATKVRFTFPNQRVTGDFPVDLTASEPVAVVESGSSTVTINFTSPTEGKNTRHFYIPLPTGTLNGLSIDYLDADDNKISGTHYESSGTWTISRRTYLKMPGLVLTVINAGIE